MGRSPRAPRLVGAGLGLTCLLLCCCCSCQGRAQGGKAAGGGGAAQSRTEVGTEHDSDRYRNGETSQRRTCSNPVESAGQSMTADEFATRHVLRQSPALLVDALSNATAAHVWSQHYLTSVPHAATTWVNVQGKYDSADGARRMTLREYVRRASNRSTGASLFLNDEVPLFMQKDVVMPKALLCRDLIRLLKSHSIRMGYDKFVSPFTQPDEDTVICAIAGRMYFDLARTGTLALGKGLPSAPFDCRRTSSHESEDEFTQDRLQAKIMSGDCLYIPSTWAYAAKANGQHLTVSLQWEADASASGNVTCGQPPASTLLGLARQFALAKPQRNPEDDALLHYFLFYLGDNLASSFTEKQFARKLKQDEKLLGKLTSWDDECTDIAKELFETLDVDKNGVYQADDMHSLNLENIDSIIALIRDRLVDFNGVIAEQQKQAVKKAARKLTSLQDELESRLVDELSKMQPEQQQQEPSDKKVKGGGRRDGKQQPPTTERAEDVRRKPTASNSDSELTTDDSQDYEIVDNDEELEIIADDDEDADQNAGATPSPVSVKQPTSGKKPAEVGR